MKCCTCRRCCCCGCMEVYGEPVKSVLPDCSECLSVKLMRNGKAVPPFKIGQSFWVVTEPDDSIDDPIEAKKPPVEEMTFAGFVVKKDGTQLLMGYYIGYSDLDEYPVERCFASRRLAMRYLQNTGYFGKSL